uniref:UDP-N-acetyl glucosamine 2-epimerase n=1 Tax=Agathobacter sp. TaxID=2021311 RepID=UPI004056A83F
MTGRMMIAIEDVLWKEKPDWLLVYGDTNSTLAAALAAAKLHIKICHVEAGARTYSKTNPEEMNRICTDHLSELLLASTQSGMDAMKKEGLSGRGYLVGDPMYDAFIQYSKQKAAKEMKLQSLSGELLSVPNEYYYLTCHREENTNEDKTLLEILLAMEKLDAPAVYPVHPRNKKRALYLQEQKKFRNIIFTEPVGYLESICLVNHAKKIVTDSGGLQREAFFAKKKCVTVLDFICWPETMAGNRNTIVMPYEKEILHALQLEQKIDESYMPFGDGKSAEKIVQKIEYINEKELSH